MKRVQPAEGRTHAEEPAGAAAASAKGGARRGPRRPGAEALWPAEPGAGALARAAVTGSALLVEPCVCTRAHVHRTSPTRPGQRDAPAEPPVSFPEPGGSATSHTRERRSAGYVLSTSLRLYRKSGGFDNFILNFILKKKSLRCHISLLDRAKKASASATVGQIEG